MRKIITGAVLVLLAGCASGQAPARHPGAAACRAAMRADYQHAVASPSAAPAGEPASCRGLPAATLRRIASEILAGR
jgi:hypothetical protein